MTSIKNLNPRSLVMTVNECFYCKKQDETIKYIYVDRLFGVKACNEHNEHAESDMKSYMKKYNIVHVKEAILLPEVKELFDFLTDDMKIVRTNGTVDSGWKLLHNFYEFIPSFKKVDGVWRFPIMKETSDLDYTTKMVRISSMFDEKLDYHKNENFSKLVENAISSLELKLSSYIEKDFVVDYEDEHPSIKKFVINGRMVRVFEHESV